MYKKGAFCFLVFLLVLSFVFAAENSSISVDSSSDESSKINKAYTCLNNLIEDKGCEDLSLEEKIFSVMATGKCKTELNKEKSSSDCFPKTDCTIKRTAQALLALGKDKDVEKWLIAQNKTVSELIWYLQIESSNPTFCTITYEDSSYDLTLDEDKKIDARSAGCFSPSEMDYWLKVSPSCYDKEFKISCDESFQTNLLFKRETSSTIHISEKTSSASAQGSTKEKINSVCFAKSNSCDYEGSLWAAAVLNKNGYDVEAFLPYLVVMSEDEVNDKFLPESFLYNLLSHTGFRTSLLEKQKGQWWDESGDKFFDTALALYPFQSESVQEKETSKEWLLEIQDEEGCWQGNIRNTAFLLASIWPKTISDDEEFDCEEQDFFCISSSDCANAGGQSLDYSCAGMNVCCNKNKVLQTCQEKLGKICNDNQECSVSTISASDTLECCPGVCETPAPLSQCELYSGFCKTYCSNTEEEIDYSCDYASDVCCTAKTSSSNKLLIWVLVILIILVLIGFFFQNQLRSFWFRLKSNFNKSSKPPRDFSDFSVPRNSSREINPLQRRIIPRELSRPRPQRQSSSSSDLDEVLKKLKDMGK